MANITFISPKMKKDITVHATAGDRSTLLAMAREHSIPLDFECQDGERSSRAVQVIVLENNSPLGINLTEKEKTVLKLSGKINKDHIAAAETGEPRRPGAWPASSSCAMRTYWRNSKHPLSLAGR